MSQRLSFIILVFIVVGTILSKVTKTMIAISRRIIFNRVLSLLKTLQVQPIITIPNTIEDRFSRINLLIAILLVKMVLS